MVSDHFFEQRTEGTNMLEKHDCIRFISVGSLVGLKGFDLIINALSMSKSLAKCMLSIIGSGPEEANLHRLIEANGLQDKVHLLGQKTSDEVSAQIAASDCFILLSRRETFGIVYIEAMAKGKPVIATICGGPEGFVNDTNGILIPTDDVEAAAKAIDYMVENLDKYESTQVSNHYVLLHSLLLILWLYQMCLILLYQTRHYLQILFLDNLFLKKTYLLLNVAY
jgi:glycosyltransferase involved in cell wall biosynthesis